MKKWWAFFLLVVWNLSTAFAWEQRPPLSIEQCTVHSPYGWPQSQRNVTPICRTGYFVGYDAAAKIPNYVTYTLTPPNALGCVARTNAFVADQSVQNGATPQDYVGTGFDKGHASPDGDQSWDVQVEFESFLMTNMYPQAGSLNRGIWKLLETSVRGWAVQKNQSFTIYVGGLYGPENKTIGKGVIVPHGFYKIVINNQTDEVAGWGFPHNPPYPNLGNNLVQYRVPIAQIEQQAGVKFLFPTNAIELQSGQEWSVDYGKLTASKKQKCGANATE